MRNLAPTRSLVRRSRTLLTLALVVGALGAFIASVGFVLYIIPLVSEGGDGFGLFDVARGSAIALGALLFLIAVGMAVRAATWRTDNDLAETKVAPELARQLDASYTFIRNISDRKLGYIDAVLVGPPGLLTFRILDSRGIFANDGPDWLVQNKKGELLPWRISPTREVVADIEKLRAFLTERNLGDVPVYGVIVFVHEPPETQLMGKNTIVPLTHLSSLILNLKSSYLAVPSRIDARRVADTVRALYKN